MIRINIPWIDVEQITPVDDDSCEPAYHDKIVSAILHSDFKSLLNSPKTAITITIKAAPPGYRTIDAVDLATMVIESVKSVLGRFQVIDNLRVKFIEGSEVHFINIKISVA